jgi:hypothetical protein
VSNHLAIATVTGTLRRTLHETVQQDVTSAKATAIRPDTQASAQLPNPGVNVYLYQVTPNPSWRNEDLPTRGARGHVVRRPRVALDLHYLFTFHGDDTKFEPQRVLGSVARALHARPILTRKAIRATIADPLFSSFLEGSNLDEEVELVKLTPVPFNLEELSKLWSVLFQTTYTLSMSYMASVVLIETDDSPQRALPVRQRNIGVYPFRHAVIEEVVGVDGAEPIEMGDTIVLRGSQLSSVIDRVRVGVADLDPVPDTQTSSELRVALTDPALRAGVLGVQVVFEDANESNVAPLVLRPVITVDTGVSSTAVPITFDPAVGRAQRVVLFLNELNVGLDHEPRAYSFEAPENNGIPHPEVETDPEVEETLAITFAISDITPGTYVVRVHVSGAENVLTVDGIAASPTFGMYIEPSVEIL